MMGPDGYACSNLLVLTSQPGNYPVNPRAEGKSEGKKSLEAGRSLRNSVSPSDCYPPRKRHDKNGVSSGFTFLSPDFPSLNTEAIPEFYTPKLFISLSYSPLSE